MNRLLDITLSLCVLFTLKWGMRTPGIEISFVIFFSAADFQWLSVR